MPFFSPTRYRTLENLMDAKHPMQLMWRQEIDELIAELRAAGDDQWQIELEDALGRVEKQNDYPYELESVLSEMRKSDTAQRLGMDERIGLAISRLWGRSEPVRPVTIQRWTPEIAAAASEAFYTNTRILITKLRAMGRNVLTEDLARAMYGATGSEVVCNITHFLFFVLQRAGIAIQTDNTDVFQATREFLGLCAGTRRKRAAIPLPAYTDDERRTVDVLRMYERVRSLIAELHRNLDAIAEELQQIVFDPTLFLT